MYCFNTPREGGVLEGGMYWRGGLYFFNLSGGPKCSKNQSKSMSKVPISSHKHAYFALLRAKHRSRAVENTYLVLIFAQKGNSRLHYWYLVKKIFWGGCIRGGDVLLQHPPRGGCIRGGDVLEGGCIKGFGWNYVRMGQPSTTRLISTRTTVIRLAALATFECRSAWSG